MIPRRQYLSDRSVEQAYSGVQFKQPIRRAFFALRVGPVVRQIFLHNMIVNGINNKVKYRPLGHVVYFDIAQFVVYPNRIDV